jgi:predicted dehydrogenase
VLKRKIEKAGGVSALNTSGRADIRSKYGGIFFYGVHQVDVIVMLLGPDARECFVHRNGPNAVATILYPKGTVVTMNCFKEDAGGFHWRACTREGVLTHLDPRDPKRHRRTVKVIYDLIRTRRNPLPRKRLLATVALLESLEKSLRTGRPVKVPRL